MLAVSSCRCVMKSCPIGEFEQEPDQNGNINKSNRSCSNILTPLGRRADRALHNGLPDNRLTSHGRRDLGEAALQEEHSYEFNGDHPGGLEGTRGLDLWVLQKQEVCPLEPNSLPDRLADAGKQQSGELREVSRPNGCPSEPNGPSDVLTAAREQNPGELGEAVRQKDCPLVSNGLPDGSPDTKGRNLGDLEKVSRQKKHPSEPGGYLDGLEVPRAQDFGGLQEPARQERCPFMPNGPPDGIASARGRNLGALRAAARQRGCLPKTNVPPDGLTDTSEQNLGESLETVRLGGCPLENNVLPDGSVDARGRNLGALRAAAVDTSEGKGRLRRRSSSYVALTNAFSALYNGDDFWRERIASGFFSVVYKVTHRTTGEVLVMKISQQTNTRANNLHEIELLNRLHHPNILRLKGVCIEEGQLHALTEYVNGGNLQELICDDREYLSWPDRLKLSSDIADGMKYLHSKGFMHRDLSSQNILVRRKHLDFECVIADLGLAVKKPKSEDEVLRVVGTPYWISPECLHGKFYGSQSDVFSFGIVMCEIIARVSADPEELPRTMDFGLNEAAFELLAGDCPKDMLRVAFHCCKLYPKDRPAFPSIVSTLSEMRHSHVTNISKSLSCTNTGTEVSPARTRSRTVFKEPPCLPRKHRTGRHLVRSNSDCGMRDLNFRRVSQRLNPFSDSPPQDTSHLSPPGVTDGCGLTASQDLRSPVTKLCYKLTSVWPRSGDSIIDGAGERNRFASLPCYDAGMLLQKGQSLGLPGGDDRESMVQLDFDTSALTLVKQRLMFQEA